MPISDKDRAFMQQVAAYFRSTKNKDYPEGSIRDTADHFGISRNKIRKILITTGDISNSLTKEAAKMQSQGMSIEAIADKLGVSKATVSIYLPYTDTIKDSLDPTTHTQAVRKYRAYEKQQTERQVQNKEKKDMPQEKQNNTTDNSWKEEWLKERKLSYTETNTRPARSTWEDARQMRESIAKANPQVKKMVEELVRQGDEKEAHDMKEYTALKEKESGSLSEQEKARLSELERELGFFPGALQSRNGDELEKISGEQLPFEPREVRRLHLELDGFLNDEESEILRKYGGVKYGESISRDVVVPSDFPLYALHFLIQRLFGWQNSHLHRFWLGHKDLLRVTDNEAAVWAQLVGIVFRSPYMNEDDEFWADDYNGGSFKNWLTKKYTGPYLSQCRGEGIMSCMDDMQDIYKKVIDDDALYYILHVKYDEDDDRIVKMVPVHDAEGNKNPEPTADWISSGKQWVETVEFADIPVDALNGISERGCFDIIERLPADCIFTKHPEDINGKDLTELTYDYVQRAIKEGIDSPELQVLPQAFTSTLFYTYDFGDNWVVKITATEDCEDLVEQGRITQEQLDKAQIKCRELYRPVTLAVDGEMLMDDAGGMSGFVNFLKTINPDLAGMSKEEKDAAKSEKREMLDWARKVQNWKKLNPMI